MQLAFLRAALPCALFTVGLALAPAAIAQPRAIAVPANSPLRGGILVQPVHLIGAIQRLEIPAAIEVDPVLAEKVVPPAAGRIRDILVAAGDHVTKGQLIARMESVDSDRPSINLVSPATGTVTEMTAARGAFYDVPLQPVATVARFDTVRATLAVPEKHVALARPGETVRLALLSYPGETFTGRIAAVGDMLDPDTRRLKVRVSLPNRDGRLKPGMFGTAVMEAAPARMPRIPASALVLDGASDAVFVEVSPWRFVKRRIQTGLQDGDSVFVKSGLSNNDRVVVKGAVLLND